MANKLPFIPDNHKICIICEGNEEYEYLNRLKDLKVWNEQYDISLVNDPLIKEYTGVENYKGRADQIEEVMKHVTGENYVDMCHRVRNLESDDSVTGSSNFGKFIKLFESDDSGWIKEINTIVEM